MNAISPSLSASSVLSTRAMIVTLSISQWSGRRLDREVTDEVNQNHNAAADAGRYNKLLLPKEALADIVSIVGATRTDFLKRTLPWMDNGGRIMAADAYLAHMAWARGQASKFDKAVADFVAKYPGYVVDAHKRLGSMFRPEDYPDVSTLADRFKIECKVMPVPTSADFRVEMSEAQAASIRADIEANVTEATTAAVRDVYRRVADVTERMVDRLNAYRPATGKGDKAEGIFRDSLVNNVRDLIGVLPALNITGDPALTMMAEKLKPLARHDATALREDADLRRDVAAEAQAILDSVSGFLA